MEPRPEKRMKTEAEALESSQELPDDLVLEIVARCPTIADVIRCAAASKPIRRGILHAPFLRRLRGFLTRNGDGRPPVRKLLVGLYHQISDPHRQPPFAPVSDGAHLLPPSVAALAAPAPNRGGGAYEFGPYLPVASSRSLLVLRRRCRNRAWDHCEECLYSVELSVCNPITGERCVLPPHDVFDMSHALLDVDPTAPSSSFKLLVAKLSENDPSTLYVQVFSSEVGEWGPPLACPITSNRGCEFVGADDGSPRPVVVGDTVHWLCTTEWGDRILSWQWRGGGEHESSIVKLPRGFRLLGLPEKCLAVLPSTDDDAAGPEALLSLIVLVHDEIEVWAREKGGTGSRREWKWKLRHRIRKASISRPVNLRDGWMIGAELSWFCEGSDTLFLRAGDGTIGPLLLDLQSMEVSKIEVSKWERNTKLKFCPYEIDLLSYMRFMMKRF